MDCVYVYIYIFVSFIPITSGANHKPAHGLLPVAGGADERWRCLLAQHRLSWNDFFYSR